MDMGQRLIEYVDEMIRMVVNGEQIGMVDGGGCMADQVSIVGAVLYHRKRRMHRHYHAQKHNLPLDEMSNNLDLHLNAGFY